MAAGRRPPIIPRNSLAEGRIAGRKPPLPYKLAVMKLHEQRRMERGMAGIAAVPTRCTDLQAGDAPPEPRTTRPL